MDFKVINVDQLTGKITFGFGIGTPQKTSGIDLLVQLIVVNLLKTPGRDVINPASGGGFKELIGGNINPDDTNEMVSEISSRVKKVKSDMIENQLNVDIPANERLQSLNIVDVSVDSEDITGYNCTIEVINEDEDISKVVFGVSMFSGS